MFAAIWVDFDDTETVSLWPNVEGRFLPAASFFVNRNVRIKERGQPATSPIVEELNLGHVETGWAIRVRNRMVRTFSVNLRLKLNVLRKGITCEDVLFAIYDFFASPLYVDELGEMHPRAVRIMEQQYFEKRRMGFFDLMEGYRKSDALLGATYFDGYCHLLT
ncbi:hypothetical protein L202_02267 [Cryptococcus amylolentus CBS 6039]|uniref:DUF6699 domain-containing protein n=1 Tax=Cryptococcus amylolentus CBS 6039 TaxID=1295533 RepID=A0A1E3HZW3_9TREE|nr:hypothetical protein L202_02267 [Cryptococcus amylolentus CBS 6039]ODN81923.1 hypothetical protein L202_02267 [Cryptococcus amylolentus CBS 6039]